jgi:hypothetical protein
MRYAIYKGKLGYYVFADKVVLIYKKGSWKSIDLDPTQIQWQWTATDLATSAQEVTDLELLVMTGTSRGDLKKQIAIATETIC